MLQPINDDEEVADNNNETQITAKSLPIYIPNIVNRNKMINNIAKVVPKDEFSYKCLKGSEVRLMVKKADFSKKHQVRNITNIRSRVLKEPLRKFYIDLRPKPNDKDIFNVRRINHTIICVEASRKPVEMVQCYRCQLSDHTCCKELRSCVKCDLNNPPLECKNRNSPAIV